MPSRPHRDIDCLRDIIENIDRIERHVAGFDRASIEHDGMRRDAVERCLERICEAAFRLGDRADALMPGHPWRDIRGMGNWLRHAYDRVEFSIVWNVVSERLPRLKAGAIDALARSLRGDADA